MDDRKRSSPDFCDFKRRLDGRQLGHLLERSRQRFRSDVACRSDRKSGRLLGSRFIMSRNALFHERLYRGDEAMRRVYEMKVTVCGAGALGANITESLARQGFGKLRVIDRDRIEERNLSTQPYFKSDVGAFKAKILANTLYRALGVEVEAIAEDLTPTNTDRLLSGSELVLETFDTR